MEQLPRGAHLHFRLFRIVKWSSALCGALYAARSTRRALRGALYRVIKTNWPKTNASLLLDFGPFSNIITAFDCSWFAIYAVKKSPHYVYLEHAFG